MKRKRKSIPMMIMILLGFLVMPCIIMAAELMPSSYSFWPDDGDQGTWTYDDPNRTKLTDGVYGTDNWTSTYDRWLGWWGIEWDGGYDEHGVPTYSVRNIQLEFSFASPVYISSIKLGTNQDVINNWNVVFPSYISVTDGSTVQERNTPFDINNSGENNGCNNGKRHNIICNFDTRLKTNTITIGMNNSDNFDALVWYDNMFTDANGVTWNGYYEANGVKWDNRIGSKYNGMFWVFLDEVDFYGQPVPAPATILLMGSGLLGLAVFSKKKRLS